MAVRKSALEKEFFSAIPQSLTIKQLLQVPSQHRTIQHCKAIINHVKNVSFLERYMNSNEIFGIAKEMELKSYDSRSTVFNHGDAADNFYIILSGSVKLYIPMPYQTKKVSDLKEVMVLGKGEAFGELALLYDSVRSATVVAVEPCDFIVLNKESFRKHIKTISTTHMGQIMEFYQEFAAFQSLSNKDIVKYATKSLFYKFPSNTVVVREGDYPEEIFFLKSGRVKIVKRLNFKINPVTKALQYDDPSEPTQEDIERGHYKSMLIEIDELSPGDSFCDASILNKEPMHHTIICSMPCELIALPHYDLKTMSTSLLEEYQTLCKTYPDNTDLRKAYLDRTKWDSWKKNLYQNIQIDKTNRRRGFDQQLRGPFIKRIQLEKLTIPLETDIKTNLLNMINQTVQTARVGTHTKLIESPNPTYNNLSRIKTGQDGSISKRKVTVPSLPKINNINTTAKDLSSFRNGSYSHRDYSTMSANKLKFDFVVPKHRLANYEEKEVTTKGNEGEVINYNEGKVTNTELTDEKARALVNFNFEELPPLTTSVEDLEEDEKKSGVDEDSSSVLGTRNIESTFTKVMSTMNLEMPTLKKKYKIKGSTLL